MILTTKYLLYTAVSAIVLLLAFGLNDHSAARTILRRLLIPIAVLLFLMPAGQALENPAVTYPFSYWGMYGQKNPSASYYSFIISDETGIEAHYPFRLVAFSSPRAAMRKVSYLMILCRVDQHCELLDSYLDALVLIYTRQTGNKVQEFRIYRVFVDPSNAKVTGEYLQYSRDYSSHSVQDMRTNQTNSEGLSGTQAQSFFQNGG